MFSTNRLYFGHNVRSRKSRTGLLMSESPLCRIFWEQFGWSLWNSSGFLKHANFSFKNFITSSKDVFFSFRNSKNPLNESTISTNSCPTKWNRSLATKQPEKYILGHSSGILLPFASISVLCFKLCHSSEFSLPSHSFSDAVQNLVQQAIYLSILTLLTRTIT